MSSARGCTSTELWFEFKDDHAQWDVYLGGAVRQACAPNGKPQLNWELGEEMEG